MSDGERMPAPVTDRFSITMSTTVVLCLRKRVRWGTRTRGRLLEYVPLAEALVAGPSALCESRGMTGCRPVRAS